MKLAILAFVVLSGSWLYSNTTYLDQPCGKYVCARAHRPTLSAQEIWDGANGKLRVVQAQAQFEDLISDSLQEGDIVAFHGVHVGVYHHGQFMDSDPRHHGPGPMQYSASDAWFSGPVRILRWN
jgi:hypothetical protein